MIPIATAATIAAAVWLGPQVVGSARQTDTVLRDTDAESGPRVLVVQPADRATLPRDSLLFVWRPVAGQAFYSFRLTDVSGDILWEGSTADTLISLNREIGLACISKRGTSKEYSDRASESINFIVTSGALGLTSAYTSVDDSRDNSASSWPLSPGERRVGRSH